MIVEEALFTQLQTYPDLAALVGNRIYPLRAPVGVVFPCVTYQLVSSEFFTMLSGWQGDEAARYQLTGWAVSKMAAYELGYILAKASVGMSWAGELGSVTLVGRYDIEDSTFTPPVSGRVVDIQILYNQEVV